MVIINFYKNSQKKLQSFGVFNVMPAITTTLKIIFLKHRENSEVLYWFKEEILSPEAGSSVHLWC